MAAGLRFRYSLEAALSVRVRAVDSARAEELNARSVVVEKQEAAAKSRALVASLEHELRELLGEGRNFDLQRRGVLASYLASVRQRLAVALSDLAQAENVHEQARQSLQAHAQRKRALERHREMKRDEHMSAAVTAEYNAQDELWLAKVVNRD